MSRANRNLALLAIVALALVVAVLWVGRHDYLRDPPGLTALDTAAATRVELDIPSLETQVFEKRAGEWWRVRPAAARADDRRVQRLANLAATPVARWLPENEVVAAKVGLDPPSATLVVDGVRIDYGGLTALDDLRFVKVGARIALVPRQYSPEMMLARNGKE